MPVHARYRTISSRSHLTTLYYQHVQAAIYHSVLKNVQTYLKWRVRKMSTIHWYEDTLTKHWTYHYPWCGRGELCNHPAAYTGQNCLPWHSTNMSGSGFHHVTVIVTQKYKIPSNTSAIWMCQTVLNVSRNYAPHLVEHLTSPLSYQNGNLCGYILGFKGGRFESSGSEFQYSNINDKRFWLSETFWRTAVQANHKISNIAKGSATPS